MFRSLYRRIWLVSAMALAVAVLTTQMSAANEKEKKVTITGTVSVVNGKEALVSVTVTTDEGAMYKVVLDENGKKLAKLDGKNVKVVGTVEKKGDKNPESWITVLSFEEVK